MKKHLIVFVVLFFLVNCILPVNGIYAQNSYLIGESSSVTNEGWTLIQPSADSRIVYVSSSTGNDTNDGLSPDKAVKTLARANSLMRNGYPDHMLLKRGDLWKDESLGGFKSGRSEKERMLISYYGTSGKRPLVKCSSNFIDHGGKVYGNFAVVGLELVGYKMDPKDPGYDLAAKHPNIRLVGGGDNILLEDCKIQYMEIVVQGYNGNTYGNFKLRRNIITDVYAHGTTTGNSSRPSGIYAENTDGLLIEENVFDHNGWHSDIPDANANMYNHNLYIQTNNVGNKVVVRGNIITRGSSHGIHGRPGGLYEDNLLALNACSLSIGYKEVALKAGTFAIVKDNVILAGRLMDPTDSSWPRTTAVWGLPLDNLGEGTVTIERNIVANRRDNGTNTGIFKFADVKYSDNIQYNWGGGLGDMNDPSWPDPTRSIASYHGSIGKTPSFEAFIEVARNRALNEWPKEYSALAVNEYIREGFNLTSSPKQTATPTSKPTATSTPTRSSTAITDLNGDGIVNMSDVILVAASFNSIKGDAKYIKNYDLNNDNSINIIDIMMIAKMFNSTL